MRFLARFIIGVTLCVLLLSAGIYLLHRPLIRAASERILAGAGLVAPQAELRAVSLSRLDYDRITSGGGALALEDVSLEFDWRDLLFKRRAKGVRIGGAEASITIGEKGGFSIAGFAPRGGAGGAPPFDRVDFSSVSLIAHTPKGDARSSLAGAIDFDEGGKIDADIAADAAGFEAASVEGLAGGVSFHFAADGRVTGEGELRSDISTPLGVVRAAQMQIASVARDWRSIFTAEKSPPRGLLTVNLESSTIEAAASGEAPNLSASGGFAVELSDAGLEVRLGGAPFRIGGLRDGGELALSARDKPLFRKEAGGGEIAVDATLSNGVYRGGASLEASTPGDGAWAYSVRAGLKDPMIAGFSFGAVDVDANGEYRDGRMTGAADMAALVRKAEIGRMQIMEMPVTGRVAIAGDIAARAFTISALEGACLAAPHAAFSLKGQDLDARLGEARLCAAGAPFVVVDWSGELAADVIGELSARTGRLRLGRTLMEGAPPKVIFAAGHDHERHSTIVDGRFEGGAVVLNNVLALSRSNGTFRGGLVGEALTFDADFSALRIAQTREVELVAPVAARGKARLAADVVNFDFEIATLSGEALGSGVGAHHVITGRGKATFTSDDIVFARAGLQPEKLMPVLLGVIFDATGVGAGEAHFSWSPGVVNSSAEVEVVDLSFAGPSVAVTRTEGVSGAVSFTNLSPIATDGEQIIAIRKVDLDALKLEDGEMRFELPGDDTLHVIDAEFPWFGGTIGAYDAKAPLSGGKADLRLQIDAVDLSRLLSYLKIEGLSGEGVVEGVLPLSIDSGKARINHGVLSATGPGVIRYEGKMTDTAAQSNEQAELAFEVLRELRFTTLTTTIDGALDGELNFKVYFEGVGKIPVRTGKTMQRVDSPVIYRVTIDAPLMRLIDQAVTSSDVRLQIKRAKEQENSAGAINE